MSNRFGFPVTKFHTPVIRRNALPRVELVEAVWTSASKNPVTLISAAAGYGKTTLLSLLALRAKSACTPVWIALDASDNELDRFGALLLGALEQLELDWEIAPAAIVKLFSGKPVQVACALNVVINALCTHGRGRIVLIFDDLHRLDDARVFGALDYLIERLPEHVGLVMATRSAPALSFARLRARDALGYFEAGDLRFSDAEAWQYLPRTLRAGLERDTLARLIADNDGWPVGLSLGVNAMIRQIDRGAAQDAAGHFKSGPHVFDFLAQEVFRNLAEDLQRFLMQTSLLGELSPAGCAFLTGCANAEALLAGLVERNLFVTVIDEAAPVLRLHDLFRAFLQQRLARLHPEQVAGLHARAAQVATSPLQAITHYLDAEAWHEASAAIVAHGEQFIAEGTMATLERLAARLPAAIRSANPHCCQLLGTCSWTRWDAAGSIVHFSRAAALFEQQGDLPGMTRALLALSSSYATCGMVAESVRTVAQVVACGRPDAELHHLPVQQAWLALIQGDMAGLAACFERILALAHAQAGRLEESGLFDLLGACIHCHLTGLPASAAFLSRLNTAVRASLARTPNPALAGMAHIMEAWMCLWRGELADAWKSATLAEQENRRSGWIKGLTLDILQLKVLYFAVGGEAGEAALAGQALLAELADAPGFGEAWRGAYLHAAVRASWMLDDHGRLAQTRAELAAAAHPNEWPFMRGTRILSDGYMACTAGDYAAAARLFGLAAVEQATYPLPAFHGDARIGLAYAQAMLGQAGQAWATFRAVLADVAEHDMLGRLLFDNGKAVTLLFALAPAETEEGERAAVDALAARYRAAAGPSRTQPVAVRRDSLSARELQVLQLLDKGASNKRIAQDLFLSLHTVKRHVANIIDKLYVGNRAEAAAFYRDHIRGRAPDRPAAG
jgi:LuxR family maltose regulon positive regulatory protein